MTTAPARFTRDDYMQLPEGYPAQLVEGFLVKDPSPTPWHQRVSMRLVDVLLEQVGVSRVLAAPLDLFLDELNVYQPDVLVYQQPPRIGPEDREIETPVLVVEVLSGSTASYDRGVKARRYLGCGVREVWLVDPLAQTIEVRTVVGSVEIARGDVATSRAIEGLAVEVDRLFRR